MKRTLKTLLGALLACQFTSLTGQNPIPDLTFGVQGGVYYNTTIFFEAGEDVAIQPWDGKIVVAGTVSSPPYLQGVLVRFNPDGSVDTGFGNNGLVPYLYPDIYTSARSLLIQPDHSILVAGEFGDFNQMSSVDMLVARFLENGAPDSSFGDDGVVVLVNSDLGDYGGWLALQPDQKILVAGTATDGTNSKIELARLLSNGHPDESFGPDGRRFWQIGEGPYCTAYNVAWQDGKILTTGLGKLNDKDHILVMRFTAAGDLDPGFGTGGVSWLTTTEYSDFGTDLLPMADGKILLAGGSTTLQQIFVARLTDTGGFDTSFGVGGSGFSYVNTCCFSIGPDILVQPDQKILLAANLNYDFSLCRFLPDGTPDSLFAMDGVFRGTNYGLTDADNVGNMAFQSDGKLIVAGSGGGVGGDQGLTLARYDMGIAVGAHAPALEMPVCYLYPNPVRSTAHLEYFLDQADVVSIRLLDAAGRPVEDFQHLAFRSAGKHQEQLRLDPSIAPGVYFLEITTSKWTRTMRLIYCN